MPFGLCLIMLKMFYKIENHVLFESRCLQQSGSAHTAEQHGFYAGIILFPSVLLFLGCTGEESGPQALKSKHMQAYSSIIWMYPSETKSAFTILSQPLRASALPQNPA